MEWDLAQQQVLEAVGRGESLLVQGAPGSGKSTLAVDLTQTALVGGAAESAWAPAMLMTPDRRRAADLDLLLAPALTDLPVGVGMAQGSHRLVRSLDSYAFLVVSLWLVERADPLPRPVLTSGAREDAWISRFLSEHPEMWQEDFSEAVVGSPVFRDQVRSVIARAGQAGLMPQDLAALGELSRVPLWGLAAQLYAAFAGTGVGPFTLGAPNLDSARIARIAAGLLRNWVADAPGQGVSAPPPVPALVVVDDAQDLTAAAASLLQALADSGAQMVLFWQPDEAAAAYRGGNPAVVRQLADKLGWPVLQMPVNHRGVPAVTALTDQVRSWLHPAQKGEGAGGWLPGGPVRGLLVPSVPRRAALTANLLRSRRLHNQTPWEQMGVIVRSADEVEPLSRALARAEVPVASGERPVVLSKIPVCQALLVLLAPPPEDVDSGAEADTEVEWDAQVAQQLLLSPLVGADSLAVYRVLRAMRFVDPELSVVGLLEIVGDRDSVGGADTDRSVEVDRILASEDARTAEQIEKAARLWSLRDRASRMPAEQGLWLLWQAAAIAEPLREVALASGEEGQVAQEQLDAALALFRKADLWAQSQLLATPAGLGDAATFAKQTLEEEVETDPLVPSGLQQTGVHVLTPAQSAGGQWDYVIVLGLQDGQWPRTSREQLGRISQLDGILQDARTRGWEGQQPISGFLPDPQVGAKPARMDLVRQERISEARLLVTALSRARSQVDVIAVDSEDQVPSSFFRQLERDGVLGPLRDSEDKPIYTHPDPNVDAAFMVGAMRRTLVTPDTSERQRKDAARVLSILAAEGVVSADPNSWGATGSVSTDSPILSVEPLRLSPSSLQSAVDCPLRWFLTSIHASNEDVEPDPSDLAAARLGSLLHQVAEENPRADGDQMVAALEQKWEEWGLATETTWAQKMLAKFKDAARTMGNKFSQFQGEVLVEKNLSFPVGNATVAGRADRIEVDEDGKAVVVDLKTGTPQGRKDQPDNLQLASYQLGVEALGRTPGGAYLYYPAEKTGQERKQGPLEGEERAEMMQRLEALADSLGSAVFQATPATGNCRICQFRDVCPAQPESSRRLE